MTWRFEEFLSTIDTDDASPIKNLFLKSLDVLSGGSDPSEVDALLKEGNNDKT